VKFARPPHWNLSFSEAARLQTELAPLVSFDDRVPPCDLVAAVDLAMGRWAKSGRVAVVVWDRLSSTVVEEVLLELPLTVPYVPGFLALREGPLIEVALGKLRSDPDVLLIDGHGVAHPRRFGIAAQLGVLLDRVTIGVGKTRLCGIPAEPGPAVGDRVPLISEEGENIGVLLRSRAGCRPLYVSTGHRISHDAAAEVVELCLRGNRLPEPLHLADRLSKARHRQPEDVGRVDGCVGEPTAER
jgi:deoxyribonuclease V